MKRLVAALVAALLLGASPAHAAARHFHVASLNVKCNPTMAQDRVVHDVQAAAKVGGLIGWQEICLRRYADAIKALPGWDTYLPYDRHLLIEDPISWRTSNWTLVDSGWRKISDGRAHVTPNRYVTWVLLRNRVTGTLVARVNTHWISGAWKRHATAFRKRTWYRDQAGTEAVVRTLAAQGYRVVVTGDFNRRDYPVLGNTVVYDASHRYDYVAHAPHRGLRATAHWTYTRLYTDHDLVAVRYTL